MAVERLQKILSNAGIASRREAEDWLLEGRITVNGNPVTELGARADLDTDEILVDGIPVNRGMYRYFALNKPIGVLTTAKDDRGRATVLDLVPIGDIVLHPVGRLDLDSEGLLLITNDGHLTDLLTHPRNEVEKEYLVGTDTQLSKTDIQRLVRGIDDKGEHLRATSAIVVSPPARLEEEAGEIGAWALLTLKEGKNREIRRMMEALGKSVKLLRRTRIARLHLGDIGPGVFRELTEQEVSLLYRDAMAARKLAEAREAAGERVSPTISRLAPAKAQPPTREQRDPERTFSPRPPRGGQGADDDRRPRGGGAGKARPGGGGGRPASRDGRPAGPRDAGPRRPESRTGAPAEDSGERRAFRDGARPRVAPPGGMSGPSRGPSRPGDRRGGPADARPGGNRPDGDRRGLGGDDRRGFGGSGPGERRGFGGGGPGGERRGPGGPTGERRGFGGGPGGGRPGPSGPTGERRGFGGGPGGDRRGPGGPGGRPGGGDRRGPGAPGGRPGGGGRPPAGGPGRGPSGPRRGR